VIEYISAVIISRCRVHSACTVTCYLKIFFNSTLFYPVCEARSYLALPSYLYLRALTRNYLTVALTYGMAPNTLHCPRLNIAQDSHAATPTRKRLDLYSSGLKIVREWMIAKLKRCHARSFA